MVKMDIFIKTLDGSIFSMGVQLSYSASQKYQMSPKSYYLHYILRLRPSQVGSPLVFGTALDEGFNALLLKKEDPYGIFEKAWSNQKINGVESDLKTSDLIKYSKADLDESVFQESDHELINAGYKPQWVSLRRKGLMMMAQYEEEIIPKIKEVLAVQKYVKLDNELGDSFVGFVDFICKWEDDRIYIVDNKTTSIKYAENAANESEQLATYFEGTKDEFSVDGVMYITVSKKIRKVKEPRVNIEIVKGEITEDLLEKTFQQYDNTLHGIKMGNFQCTGCSNNPFGCVYKRYCESDGKDLTGLTFIPKE